MIKLFLFSLCMFFGTMFPLLQAGEYEDNSPDAAEERINSSVYRENPHVAPVYFSGIIRQRTAWEIDLLSLNGHKIPVPMTVPLEEMPEGMRVAEGMKCLGIIPVLIPCGAAEEPARWRNAGASPSMVMEDAPRTLSLLQDAVLQNYQHHLIKFMSVSVNLLERMTDEKQALALEKRWAYEFMNHVFWTLLESSVPLEARMAYIKNHPSAVKQWQKESDAYFEKMRTLQSKPWSGKLRLLKNEGGNPLFPVKIME